MITTKLLQLLWYNGAVGLSAVCEVLFTCIKIPDVILLHTYLKYWSSTSPCIIILPQEEHRRGRDLSNTRKTVKNILYRKAGEWCTDKPYGGHISDICDVICEEDYNKICRHLITDFRSINELCNRRARNYYNWDIYLCTHCVHSLSCVCKSKGKLEWMTFINFFSVDHLILI